MASWRDPPGNYSVTAWGTSQPITAGSMNNIETGINRNRTDVIAIINKLNEIIPEVNSHLDQSEVASLINSSVGQTNTMATNAWTEVSGAHRAGKTNDNLKTRFEDVETLANEAKNLATGTSTNITNALVRSTAHEYNPKKADTLKDRLQQLDDEIYQATASANTAIQSANDISNWGITIAAGSTTQKLNLSNSLDYLGALYNEVMNAHGNYNNLKLRFDAIDSTNTTQNTRISTVEGILNAALISTKVKTNGANTTYDSLDARLEAIEGVNNTQTSNITTISSNITTINSNIETLTTNYQNADTALGTRIDNLNTAYQNADDTIRNTIGTGFDTTSDNTVSARVNSAETEIDTIKNTIGTGFNTDDKTIAIRKIDSEDIAYRFKETDTYNIGDYVLYNNHLFYCTANNTTGAWDASKWSSVKAMTRVKNAEAAIKTANTAISGINTKIGNGFTSKDITTTISELQSADTAINNKIGDGFDTTNTITKEVNELKTADTNIRSTINTLEAADTTLRNDIDTLESNLHTVAAELNMLGDNNVISDTNSRIDTIETVIDHVQGQDDAVPNGLKQRISAAESTISTLQTASNGLDTRLNDIDGGSAVGTTNGTLAERVSKLEREPKSATEVIESEYIEYNNEGKPTIYTDALAHDSAHLAEISTDKDYLLKKDNKYFYWKYIQTGNNVYSWEQISGGGGSGSSSGEFAETVESIENPNVNTDYFVGNNNDGYEHYRYVLNNSSNELEPVLIGKKNYYQIDTRDVQGENNETITYLDLYQFDRARAQEELGENDISNIIGSVRLPKGGSDSSYERIYVKIPAGQNQYFSYKDLQENGLNIGFSYTCYNLIGGEYNYENAAYELKLEDGTVIKQSNGVIPALSNEDYRRNTINISFNSSDGLAQYCEKNKTTKFILTLFVPSDGVTESNILPRSITVSITAVELTLSSNFTGQEPHYNTDPLAINYSFVGVAGERVTYEVMFGNDTTQSDITASAVISDTNIIINNYIFNNRTGVYNLTIRASQVINGETLYTNTLAFQLGLIEPNYNDILLFSGASLQEQIAEQYRTIELPYYLYLPSDMSTATVSYDVKYITYNENNEVVREDAVPSLIRPADSLASGLHNYSLRVTSVTAPAEYYKVTITCEEKSLVFNVKVNRAADQINVEKSGLMFDFQPEAFSNNASTLAERLWKYESNGVRYSMRIPEGAYFDWRTGGWIEDDDHVPCFCVKAGSRVEFVQQNIGSEEISPLTLFWRNMETAGSNFKCVFKIDNVKTPDAPFLTSLDEVKKTVINYGKLITSEKQDIEDDSTLLHSYLNTRYLYTKTINSSNKVVKEAVGTTVLNDINNGIYGRFGSQLTAASIEAATEKAINKNYKKIKEYIGNIYTIANQARVEDHKNALLNILSGQEIGTTIDYTAIKDQIINYLFNTNGDNTNATSVYNTLIALENNQDSKIYEYRQLEPENLDAILNGFVVEGKDGKDGIIAMLQFTFATEIVNGGTFTSQVISDNPISTNSFMSTATFLVTVEGKEYEVIMKDADGTYTEIVSIQDASNKITTSYGLQLNALGSNIFLPSGIVSYAHSEGDTIEFEYNINAPISNKVNSSVIIYEDGVPSAAKLYATGSSALEQTRPGKLIIGSDDCDVYIYKMRLYNRALTDKQILNNFYADGLTVDEMIARYNRNKNLIVDNIDDLTPQQVAQNCPDLRVIMIEAPYLTGGKTSFVKDSKIRCIYKNGRPEDNWIALNAYHAGQGTSSDNYGASGRNLDIIFGFDGKDTVIVPKPQKNNYQFDPNYKSIVVTGLNNDNSNDIYTVEELVDIINASKAEGAADVTENMINNPNESDIKEFSADNLHIYTGGTGTTSLTKDSVPNNWFNIKVNVASSENTNNAFLQKRFDRYLKKYVYTTPAQERDPKIKNDMEFFNCVIFIKETGTANEFTKDNSIPSEERQWHFYGIGNIGDSKKTDKTRVNIPGDPYEFAIEISDNGLLLSGFYSGVFYISEESKARSLGTYKDIPEAILMEKSHICTSDECTINNGNYTFTIIAPALDTMYFVQEPGTKHYHRFIYLNNTWTEVGEPISFERTDVGTKYPISKAEWECSLNTYHSNLYNFGGKGWDKSFEFRYDITTKDGETVARSDLEEALNELHQSTNKKAFADMYSYIVTVPNTNFVSRLNEWFIENSLPYWYLFTERYTMIDSRAKNTFYHYGKVYITEDEASGAKITQLEDIKENHLAEFIEANEIEPHGEATAIQIAEAELDYQIAAADFLHKNAEYFETDNGKAAINNGYRFELWGYDMDTALGINNNGQMVFSAGIEDTDKDVSGWIYNEAESVIWRRVRENMYNQLAALYIRLKGDCFNAENLINEFDTLQAQFPEELWRADFERKYYRPFRDSNETTYLNDMANGRKKYQRRQFERNMAIYINSKYQRNGSYIENDHISFRPQFTWTAGRNTEIIIKPYSTMYINFALGNYDNTQDVMTGISNTIFKRVERGEEFVINAADYIHDYNNIQCIIYNASRIMYLDGLGNFQCKQFILGSAKKLSVLKLGSETYVNQSMASIDNMGLSAGLPLLEELDLTNIIFTNPPSVFALENFPLLKKLNASRCNIQSFTFKDGGMLENITFSPSLTRINFNNLYRLADTYDENQELVPAVVLEGTANLTSYNSVNSYSNSYQIVKDMLANAGINGITELKLNDIDWTIGNIVELEPLVQLKEKLGDNMYLEGTIHVTGNYSDIEVNQYKDLLGKITFDTDNGTFVQKCKVNFWESKYIRNGVEVPEELITSTYVECNTPITDIYANATADELPKRDPTIESVFTFGSYNLQRNYVPYSGWSFSKTGDKEEQIANGQLASWEPEMNLYTLYNSTPHLYTVQWKVGNTVIKEAADQKYGDGYDLQAPTILEVREKGIDTATYRTANGKYYYKYLKGWEKTPVNISPTASEAETSIYVINGKWSEEEEVTLGSEPLTAKQLFIYSKTKTGDLQGQKFKYQMGYKGENGTEIFGDESNNGIALVPDSNRAVDDVKPFSSTVYDNGFTLVIDYQFNEVENETRPEVLVGCYDKDSTGTSITSLALYRGHDSNNGGLGTFVCYGVPPYSADSTKRKAVGNDGTHRNIIVLRRKKKDRTLYIYSSVNVEKQQQGNLGTSITVQTIPLDSQNSNDTGIYIGGLRQNLSGNNFVEESVNTTGANGIIHWMKYWNEDLGAGECMQLASWPHENMTAQINASNNDNSNRPGIYLINLNCSEHSMVTNDSFYTTENGAIFGYNSSNTKAICENRIAKGLPIELQAIIGKTPIGYRNWMYTKDSVTNATNIQLTGLSAAESYIYVPSISSLSTGMDDYKQESKYEFTSNTNSSLAKDNVLTPYNWIGDSSIPEFNSYVLATGSTQWESSSPDATWKRIRFNEKPLIWGTGSNAVNVYTIQVSELQNNETFYTKIGASNLTGKKVMVILRQNDSTISGIYMYVQPEEIMQGVHTLPNAGYFDTTVGGTQQGGWISSTPYVTRSVPYGTSGSSTKYHNYIYIDRKGTVITPTTQNDTVGTGTLRLDFAFAI